MNENKCRIRSESPPFELLDHPECGCYPVGDATDCKWGEWFNLHCKFSCREICYCNSAITEACLEDDKKEGKKQRLNEAFDRVLAEREDALKDIIVTLEGWLLCKSSVENIARHLMSGKFPHMIYAYCQRLPQEKE